MRGFKPVKVHCLVPALSREGVAVWRCSWGAAEESVRSECL